MKDFKQGKIISINNSKKEIKPTVDHQKQQKVEQMFCELQEISEKIDQHLKQNKILSPLQQLPATKPAKNWQKTWQQVKTKLVGAIRSKTKIAKHAPRLSYFKKYFTKLKRKNQA